MQRQPDSERAETEKGTLTDEVCQDGLTNGVGSTSPPPGGYPSGLALLVIMSSVYASLFLVALVSIE
jgi:hypothetical protein